MTGNQGRPLTSARILYNVDFLLRIRRRTQNPVQLGERSLYHRVQYLTRYRHKAKGINITRVTETYFSNTFHLSYCSFANNEGVDNTSISTSRTTEGSLNLARYTLESTEDNNALTVQCQASSVSSRDTTTADNTSSASHDLLAEESHNTQQTVLVYSPVHSHTGSTTGHPSSDEGGTLIQTSPTAAVPSAVILETVATVSQHSIGSLPHHSGTAGASYGAYSTFQEVTTLSTLYLTLSAHLA